MSHVLSLKILFSVSSFITAGLTPYERTEDGHSSVPELPEKQEPEAAWRVTPPPLCRSGILDIGID